MGNGERGNRGGGKNLGRDSLELRVVLLVITVFGAVEESHVTLHDSVVKLTLLTSASHVKLTERSGTIYMPRAGNQPVRCDHSR